MIGIDLLTYQMNQNILEEDLNDEEIKLIKLYLSEINGIKSKNINDVYLMPNDPKEWVSSIFNKFLNIEDKTFENKKLLTEIKSKINGIVSPKGRFKET